MISYDKLDRFLSRGKTKLIICNNSIKSIAFSNSNFPLGRWLLKISSSKLVADHKDHDQFNNIDENLRIVTKSQNCQNRIKPNRNYKSKYKGVHWNGYNWTARIQINKKEKINLGTFKTQEEAAEAYNREAVKYHGEYAYLNVIEVITE